MLLPQTAEYALRAMTCIAIQGRDGARVPARQIAGVAGIPASFLSKVLRRLVEGGLLVAEKGHGGGFGLARAAEQIHFSEIFDAVGFEPGTDHCVFGWPTCDGDRPCPLHPTWRLYTGTWRAWAEGMTLAMAGSAGHCDPPPALRGPPPIPPDSN